MDLVDNKSDRIIKLCLSLSQEILGKYGGKVRALVNPVMSLWIP
jgi:hypothetical protein